MLPLLQYCEAEKIQALTTKPLVWIWPELACRMVLFKREFFKTTSKHRFFLACLQSLWLSSCQGWDVVEPTSGRKKWDKVYGNKVARTVFGQSGGQQRDWNCEKNEWLYACVYANSPFDLVCWLLRVPQTVGLSPFPQHFGALRFWTPNPNPNTKHKTFRPNLARKVSRMESFLSRELWWTSRKHQSSNH